MRTKNEIRDQLPRCSSCGMNPATINDVCSKCHDRLTGFSKVRAERALGEMKERTAHDVKVIDHKARASGEKDDDDQEDDLPF